MKTFQELLDSGWGGRHLDPMTGGCPSCGAGELVIDEDAEQCTKCGHYVTREDDTPAGKSNFWIVLMLFALVAASLWAVGM